ncbi:hypothetical protein VTI28DRAFT_10253 [Corynascus sepedonium]
MGGSRNSGSRSPSSKRYWEDTHGGANWDKHHCRGHERTSDKSSIREGLRDREPTAKRRRVYDEGEQGREGKRSCTPGEDREGRKSSQSHRHHHRHHHPQDDRPHRHRHHSLRAEGAEPAASPKTLPFNARQLSRSDITTFRPLFAYYLDLQKQLDISSLNETELRGRWKSFMGKWNRGELAEGWYDPDIFQRAVVDYAAECNPPSPALPSHSRSPTLNSTAANDHDDHSRHQGASAPDSDSDDTYGPPPPPPPGHEHSSTHRNLQSSLSASLKAKTPGPSIPTQTDLSLRDETLAAERESALEAHRLARRAHRREEKALLDEALPPRADPGSRERRLEKRKELNEELRGFRDRSPPGAVEVGEGELMGGSAADEYRAEVQKREERRRERVSRREEVERARRAELEERARSYREREERVVEGLKELARQRFGVP